MVEEHFWLKHDINSKIVIAVEDDSALVIYLRTSVKKGRLRDESLVPEVNHIVFTGAVLMF